MRIKVSGFTNQIITILIGCFCVICTVALIINCTLIVKTMINKQEIPSFGGVFPLIVLSDSMHPKIQSGDLIICYKDSEDIEVGDIVTFYDPSSMKSTLVTHRVIDTVLENGVVSLKTKGDANNKEDESTVLLNDVVGVYKARIPLLGHLALFMQSKTGLVICSVIPLVGIIIYIMLSKKRNDELNKHDMEVLKVELAQLKAKYEDIS